MADDFKYHIDHHVGLVPPPELLGARAAHSQGRLDDAGLRAAEDDAIWEALQLQRRVGLIALGDGQFRRRNPLSVIYDNVDGFGAAPEHSAVAELLGDLLAPERRTLLESPVRRRRLAGHEAEYIVARTDRSRVIALPSPGYIAALGAPDAAAVGETDTKDAELAAIIRDEIAALAAQGVEYVQLHDPVIGFLLTTAGRERSGALGIDPRVLLDRVLAADAAVTSGLDVPAEFRVGLDITTGGAPETRQGYHSAAVAAFVERQPFSRVCVEYLPGEQARFPIELLRTDTVVALGIVDVSSPVQEPHDKLIDLVDKAATVVDVNNIALSTNGGFSAAGPLGAREQRRRLQQVEVIARFYWGNEL